MDDKPHTEKRESPRVVSTGPAEFVLDSDTVDGVTVDTSRTGICMTTPEPLEVELHLAPDETRRATLVWACQRDDGRCMYGFQYADTEGSPVDSQP